MENKNMQKEIDTIIYNEELKLAHHIVEKNIELVNFGKKLGGVVGAGALTSAFLNSVNGDTTTSLISGVVALGCGVVAYACSEKAKNMTVNKEDLVQKQLIENLTNQRF